MINEDMNVFEEFPRLFANKGTDVREFFSNWRRNKDGTYTCNGDLELRNIIKYQLVNERLNQMVVPLRAVHGKVKLDGVDLGGDARKVNFTSIDWKNLVKVAEYCKKREIPLTALNLADFDKINGITGNDARFAKNFIHMNEEEPDNPIQKKKGTLPLNQSKKCCGHCGGTCGENKKKSLKQRIIEIDQEIKAKELEESILDKIKALSSRLQKINESQEQRYIRECSEILNEANLMGIAIAEPVSKIFKATIGFYKGSLTTLKKCSSYADVWKNVATINDEVAPKILSEDTVVQNQAFSEIVSYCDKLDAELLAKKNATRAKKGQEPLKNLPRKDRAMSNIRVGVEVQIDELIKMSPETQSAVNSVCDMFGNSIKHLKEIEEKKELLENEASELKYQLKDLMNQIVGTAGSTMGMLACMGDITACMTKPRVRLIENQEKFAEAVCPLVRKAFEEFGVACKLSDKVLVDLINVIEDLAETTKKQTSDQIPPESANPAWDEVEFKQSIGDKVRGVYGATKEFFKGLVDKVKQAFTKIRDYAANLFSTSKDFNKTLEDYSDLLSEVEVR